MGSGKQLDSNLKSYFEPRFGVDLDKVRIHTDEKANRLSAYIHARALALGNNIAFAKGEYKPETPEGKKLLAHEIAHTIQQDDGMIRRKDDKDTNPVPGTSGGHIPEPTPFHKKIPEIIKKQIPGSNVWIHTNEMLFAPAKGKYNLYIYTNDRVGQDTADPYDAFEVAVGEAVKNGDFSYDHATKTYIQMNPNARFVEVNSRDNFTMEMKKYYSAVIEAGGNAIDLMTYIGHGYKTQLVLNAEDTFGTRAPKIDPDNQQNWVDIGAMQELAKEYKSKIISFCSMLDCGIS